jgi:hypothetical protein
MGATFEDFVEFTLAVLTTEEENIEFATNYAARPATIDVRADSSVYSQVNMSSQDVVDILGKGVAAGHEVRVIEEGTFELKADGDADDASKGLTADNNSSGGTLAEDLV